MLSELKLSNFRIFDDEVTVRFRPITILIGRNSSGKSSILKFLLMLKQSSLSTSEEFPVVNGNLVRLGSFTELKNTKSRKKKLSFGLSFLSPGLDLIRFERVDSKDSIDFENGGQSMESDPSVSLSGQIPYSANPQQGVMTYSVGEESFSDLYFRDRVSFADDEIFYFDAFKNKVTETRTLIRKALRDLTGSAALTEELFLAIQRSLAVAELGTEIHDTLRSLFHLPAIRGELSRRVSFSETTKESTEASREDTLLRLREIMENDPESHRFLSRFLLEVAAIESVEFEDAPPEGTRVFASNKDTGARVPLVDFGFGVSQCLPVLVKGTTLSAGSYLMVEQPEAQLHPTAQLELGSYFAGLWTERGVGSIIETHSYNLLLRLRRLIARGDLSHSDVSVAFFTLNDEKRNKAVVQNLDICEDGSMQEGLPIEFFAADIREALNLGAKK